MNGKLNLPRTAPRTASRFAPLALALAALCAAAIPAGAAGPAVNALPTGANVVAGQASISQSANKLTVNQSSTNLVTNWQTFNVGSGATVQFVQPSSTAAALNRVMNGEASQIFGQITANGRVFLVNPGGVVFGPSARVDAAGIVASTLGISNDDFMAGKLRFGASGNPASILNQGTLSGNFVALIGASVDNQGNIMAPGGAVALAAGQNVRLDLSGDGLVGVNVDGATAAARIDNSGVIAADGGRVWVTAKQAQGVMTDAINQTGTIRANTLASRNGEIWLDGGNGATRIAGNVTAIGASNGQSGGRIVASGAGVAVTGNIDASGAAGGGQIQLGGGWQGKDASIAEAGKVIVTRAATLKADATVNGNGGTVVAWSGQATQMDGAISARGAGAGNGGQVETSSRGALGVLGSVDVAAASGSNAGKAGNWLLDPYNITISAPPATDNNVSATPTFTATGTGAVVASSSIEGALNGGTSVTIATGGSGSAGAEAGNIAINSDISKTSGGDAKLTLDAAGDINLAANKAISSIAGKLDIDFGTAVNNAGTARLDGQVSTNGGSVNFYKATTLAQSAPVSTKTLGISSGTSGNITFYKDVTLASPTLSVTLGTQGAQSSSVYVGSGGAIEFKGKIQSGQAIGLASIVPQTLTVDSTGTTPGTIRFGDSVGTVANPLARLTVGGPLAIALDGNEINLKATSGDVLTAYSSLGTPTLVLGAQDTNIRVSGGTVNGVTGYADYSQQTFDIGVKDASVNRTLTITADRSIKIKNRTIDGVANGGNKTLDVTLKPFNAGVASTGGAVVMDTARIFSNGGAINVGGATASDYAVGYSGDADGVTDGIRLFNSQLVSNGGAIALRGKAPIYDGAGGTGLAGGAGVKLYGTTTIDASGVTGGNVSIDGRVLTASNAGNKDGVVIGEGSNSQTTIKTSGAGSVSINGDASAIGSAITTGSRYDGVIVSSGALIQTDAGALNITGAGGGNDLYVSDENNGVRFDTNNTRVLSNSGDITITGTAGGKSNSYGLYAKGNAMSIGGGSGIITLAGDTMQFVNTSGSRLQIASSGELRIKPLTAGTDINLGTAGALDKLALGSNWFSGPNAVFTPGFNDITIGRADGTGTITVAGATTVRDPLNLLNSGAGGKVAINAPLTVQGTGGTARTLAIKVAAGASGTGLINADALRLTGDGDFNLGGTNLINTLAANASSGSVTVNNAQTLTVGTVSSTSLGATSSTSGVVASGDVTLSTGAGDLLLTQNVQTGATNTASLSASTGAVTQSAGTLTAKKLAVSAAATSSLAQANNVGILAANIAGTNQDLSFNTVNGIVIDTVAGVTGATVSGNAILSAQNGGISQLQAVNVGGLKASATGDIDLSGASNSITNLAASTSTGLVKVSSGSAMTVGTVAGLDGVTTTNKDVMLTTSAGNLTLAKNVSAGTGTTTLTASSAAINETGSAIVTAAKLALTAAKTSSLANQNDVATLAAKVGGTAQDLTVVAKNGIAIDTVSGVTGVDVSGNAILTASNGAIGQTQGVKAAGLNALATGDIALNLSTTANTIGTLAANSGGGVVNVINSGAMTVGSVGARDGIVTADKAVTLTTTTGDLTVAKTIAAGTATTTLTATAGAVNESGVGKITSGKLYVNAVNSSALANSLNDVGTLAADVSGAAQSFAYKGVGALTLGAVGGGNGITTNSGAVQVSASSDATSVAGDLNIAAGAQVNTLGGAGKASVQLEALKGAVTETATSTIKASGLLVNAANSSDLTLGIHDIDTLAANITAANASLAFKQPGSYSVGSVNGTNGINTNNGDVTITSTGGDLTLAQNISAGSATSGVVSIDATAGAITQTGGIVTAKKLALNAVKTSSLANANDVGILAARVGGVGKDLTFTAKNGIVVDTVAGINGVSVSGNTYLTAQNGAITQNQAVSSSGLNAQATGDITLALSPTANTIGTLAAKSSSGAITVTNSGAMTVGSVGALDGVTTTNKDVTLTTTTGDLTVAKTIATGTAAGTATTRLIATAGAVNESGVGKITSGKLYVNAVNTSALANTLNDVGTLGADLSGAGQGITYNGVGALTLGAAGAGNGIVTNGGTIAVVASSDAGSASGDLAIAAGARVDTSGAGGAAPKAQVELSALKGAVTETATSTIKASNLMVIAANTTTLDSGTHDVDTVAASIGAPNAAFSGFTFKQPGSFTVGAVTSVNTPTAGTVTGITTSNGAVTLTSTAGDITVARNIGAGTAVTTLDAAAGAVNETGAAIVTAGKLAVNAANTSSLANANQVGVLGARVSGASADLTFTGANGIVVDTVSGINGVSVGRNAFLTASNGSITQNQGVSASGLAARASGDITLALSPTANSIGTLAANSSGGAVNVINSGAQTVGTVGALSGITTANKNVTLNTTTGDLTLAQNIAAGTGVVSVKSTAGAINETGAAIVTAGQIAIDAVNTSSLANANQVDTLAASVSGATADLTFTNANGIAVDTVSGISGVTVGGNAFLNANGGDITQFQGVRATGLAATASGNITLALAPMANSVGTLAARSTGGGTISVLNSGAQTIGTVGALSGVSTANADVSLTTTTGDLTQQQNIDAGTGTVTLTSAAGAVTQTGTAIVTAGKIAVSAVNTSSLANANQVGVIAARVTGADQDLRFTSANGIVVDSVSGINGVAATRNVFLTASNGAISQNQDVTAAGLSVKATGNVTLDRPTNSIGTLAAALSGAGSTLTVANAGALTVGTVGADSGISSNNGAVSLTAAAGDLTLGTDINAGSANVKLDASASGQVLQTAGGIGAGGLQVLAANGATLNSATNSVARFAASATGSGKAVSFANSGAFDVGSVGGTNGVSANGGAVTLTALGGDLSASQGISGGAVKLDASASGQVRQTGGAIVAPTLEVLAANGATLTGANNAVGIIAARVTAPNAGVAFTNSSGFDVGTAGGTSGVTTSNGVVTLTATSGDLSASQSITGSQVNLDASAAGKVTQTGGVITADQLQARAANGISATSAGNSVNTLAARTTTAGAAIAYSNAGAFNVGTVGATSGVKTNAGAVTLTALSGNLGSSQDISGSNVSLDASASGTVAQSAGNISADTLQVLAANGATLNSAGNKVGIIAANTTAAGAGVSFVNSTGFDVGTAGGRSGVITNGGAVALTAASGNLTASQSIVGGAVNLDASASGAVTQTGGTVTADTLRVLAATDATLNAAGNSVNTVAARTGGNFGYVGSGNLAVGTISGTSGIDAGGAVSAHVTGDLTLNAVVAARGTVRNAVVLAADGAFTNTAGPGAIVIPNAANGSRWLIYDVNPTLIDRRDGVNDQFLRRPATYAGYPPDQVAESGNGYITTVRLLPPESLGSVPAGATTSAPGSSVTPVAQGLDTLANVDGGGISNADGAPLTGNVNANLTAAGGGQAGLFSGEVIVLKVKPGQSFEMSLAALLGTGTVESITLADGSALPAWLRFDAADSKLKGVVPLSFSGVLNLVLTVKDPGVEERRKLGVRVVVE